MTRRDPAGPWPSRVNAVLTAFAMHAGDVDGAMLMLLEGLGGAAEAAGMVHSAWSG